jgi:hypothetical protein
MRQKRLQRLVPSVFAMLIAGLPLISDGQVWKRTEDKPDPVWRLKGITSYDFYPFPDLNTEKFYKTDWGFNYTAGVELMRTRVGDSTAWGGGLLYTYRDFDQQLKPQDTLLPETPANMSHKLRYIEVPVIYERQLVLGSSSQLSVEGGPLFSFVDEAQTTFTLPNGSEETAGINDSDFARFLFGLRAGINFRKAISETLYFETGYHGRLFLTDIGKDLFANFTGLQIRFGLTYEFKNPQPRSQESK